MKFLRQPDGDRQPFEGWVVVPHLNITWGFTKVLTAQAIAAPKYLFSWKYRAGYFGFWRLSRRRALVEALNHHLWPRCTLSRAKDSPWICVQFSLRGDNLPMLADLVMDGDQRALIDVLDRMDDFSHCPSGHWLSFRFPAHWAPSALGDARPVCSHCRNTGALDYAHFAMDPCPCANAVAVMIGGDWPAPDWPDAPHPLSPPATAQADSPEGRTQGNPTPAPDKSGPGQPGKGA
ncbi:hypothetical protein FHW96_000202 [Novosphingobium sp. SG751A]|uniref:hypothetical protein n=1 Tax=Novosphingobium sp. SG751A TaxID=2587000 RepID=UPI00155687F0|nr:hypothetical protein [Novosphingobium sp. SG751A]NOW44075.1 hypothetical protein [Novosphingobium sp. SG751A]